MRSWQEIHGVSKKWRWFPEKARVARKRCEWEFSLLIHILRGIRHFTQDFQSLTPFSRELHTVYQIVTYETQISRSLERVWEKKSERRLTGYTGLVVKETRIEFYGAKVTRRARIIMRTYICVKMFSFLLFIENMCFSEKEIANYKLQ